MSSKSASTISSDATDSSILLSFDVEEFDISQEYGYDVPEEERFRVAAYGTEVILELLDRLGVIATFFVTAHFARNHMDLTRRIAAHHEVASHGDRHDRFEGGDLLRSRLDLEDIIQEPILGFRRARLQPTDPEQILQAGYTYNSSENPIWLPGRYNNFFGPRTAYRVRDLMNIPISVTPVIRFPLFWLSFKNFPLCIIQAASAWILGCDKYLNVFYHTWEFADLKSYGLPAFIRRYDGMVLAERLERYLIWLKSRGRFVTLGEFSRTNSSTINPPSLG